MQPSNMLTFSFSPHTLSFTQTGKCRVSASEADKPQHKPLCVSEFTDLEWTIWKLVPEKNLPLTLLMSCSPVSEAVISLQSAWSAGLGKPGKHQQKQIVQYLFIVCLECSNLNGMQLQLIPRTSLPSWIILETAANFQKIIFSPTLHLIIKEGKRHHTSQILDPGVNDFNLQQFQLTFTSRTATLLNAFTSLL